MYQLFDRDTEYRLPSGISILGKDLADKSEYAFLKYGNWVFNVSDGNCILEYSSLDNLKSNYGVDVTDPDQAVKEINSVKNLMIRSRIEQSQYELSVVKAAKFMAVNFTDEQAIQVADLYPEYEVNHAYKKDERFTYNGHLFKVNQDHTSQEQWVPGETGTESLYTNLEIAGDGYLVWTQPTGAHNAYNTGDIVHYPTKEDQLYQSLIDGNTWSPDAYPQGWELYTEE